MRPPRPTIIAAALALAIGTSGAAAQEAGHRQHHPGAAAEAAPAAPPSVVSTQGAGPGTTDQGAEATSSGGHGGSGTGMMRDRMATMHDRMMRGAGPDGAAAGSDDPVEATFGAISRRMHRDLAARASGSPDADLARAMIAHHRGAVDMAKVILGFGSDPEIRRLAEGVVTAQEGEIALLRRWLARQPR